MSLFILGSGKSLWIKDTNGGILPHSTLFKVTGPVKVTRKGEGPAEEVRREDSKGDARIVSQGIPAPEIMKK